MPQAAAERDSARLRFITSPSKKLTDLVTGEAAIGSVPPHHAPNKGRLRPSSVTNLLRLTLGEGKSFNREKRNSMGAE
jgi:hypothetical protein